MGDEKQTLIEESRKSRVRRRQGHSEEQGKIPIKIPPPSISKKQPKKQPK